MPIYIHPSRGIPPAAITIILKQETLVEFVTALQHIQNLSLKQTAVQTCCFNFDSENGYVMGLEMGENCKMILSFLHAWHTPLTIHAG
jgi:hypothetical protein